MRNAPKELTGLWEADTAAARDEAWSRFADRFSPLLLHTARSACRESDRTMDAYAFVLEQLRQDDYRRLRRYTEDPRCQFTTWLVVVARRLCHDYLRRRYGRAPDDPAFSAADRGSRRRLVDLITEELEKSGALVDPAESPDAGVRRREEAAALHASLARLSPGQRLLLALRFERGLPTREIAELLQYKTVFHVYRAINAVLRELRESLTRQGIDDREP
jgi:RNA polymerase sigma factor (sigma-70 family)